MAGLDRARIAMSEGVVSSRSTGGGGMTGATRWSSLAGSPMWKSASRGPATSSANQVPISAMLVLAIGAQTPDYALDRVLETVIGAAIALAINALIVPPVALAPAHLAVGRLARDIASVLDETAAVLDEPVEQARLAAGLTKARELRVAQGRAPEPTAAILDSQTVKTTEKGGRAATTPTRRRPAASATSWSTPRGS